MKFVISLLFFCCGQFCVQAQSAPDEATQAQAEAQAQAAAKAMVQRLFAQESNEESMLAMAKEAGRAGIPRQQIIEAKLVWGLRHQNNAFLIKILPEVETLATSFDPASAAAMPNAEAIKGFASYIKALKASEAKDEVGFKQNILEAIWLNPPQAPIFAQAIDKHRLESKMAAMVIDLKAPLTNSMGEATTLQDQLGSGKALLLDFWASWCGPCMQLMPSLKKKAAALTAHGVVVAAMNKDDADAEATAERVRLEQRAVFPWLVEPSERPYSKALDINTIPRMILLSPEGKVLFNGHPEDPALWVALKKIDPAIEAPAK